MSSTRIHTFGPCSNFTTVSFYEIYVQNFLKWAQYITYVKVTSNFSTKIPYKTKQRLPCADVNLRFLQLLCGLPCRTRVNHNIENTLFLNKKIKGCLKKVPNFILFLLALRVLFSLSLNQTKPFYCYSNIIKYNITRFFIQSKIPGMFLFPMI